MRSVARLFVAENIGKEKGDEQHGITGFCLPPDAGQDGGMEGLGRGEMFTFTYQSLSLLALLLVLLLSRILWTRER